MKTMMLSLAAGALFLGSGVMGLGAASLAESREAGAAAKPAPVIVEGKDRPILLGRMVVSATPLPDLAE